MKRNRFKIVGEDVFVSERELPGIGPIYLKPIKIDNSTSTTIESIQSVNARKMSTNSNINNNNCNAESPIYCTIGDRTIATSNNYHYIVRRAKIWWKYGPPKYLNFWPLPNWSFDIVSLSFKMVLNNTFKFNAINNLVSLLDHPNQIISSNAALSISGLSSFVNDDQLYILKIAIDKYLINTTNTLLIGLDGYLLNRTPEFINYLSGLLNCGKRSQRFKSYRILKAINNEKAHNILIDHAYKERWILLSSLLSVENNDAKLNFIKKLIEDGFRSQYALYRLIACKLILLNSKCLSINYNKLIECEPDDLIKSNLLSMLKDEGYFWDININL